MHLFKRKCWIWNAKGKGKKNIQGNHMYGTLVTYASELTDTYVHYVLDGGISIIS